MNKFEGWRFQFSHGERIFGLKSQRFYHKSIPQSQPKDLEQVKTVAQSRHQFAGTTQEEEIF